MSAPGDSPVTGPSAVSADSGKRTALDTLRELLATFFYVGYLPFMPGTWGSMAAVAAFIIAGRPLGAAGWIAFGGTVLASILALSQAPRVFGAHDPKPVFLDEVAGMWLTLLLGNSSGWGFICAGFVLFRFFDGLKPFPIRRLERLPGGSGIMADDIGAGIVAGALVRLAVVFVGQ